MDDCPCPVIESGETSETIEKPNEEISESLKIEQNKKIYFLNIKIEKNTLTFIISEEGALPAIYYTKKMTLKGIKEIHKAFFGLNSCNEFLDYIKMCVENKKIFIKEKDDNITISLEVWYLFKTSFIEIILNLENINSEKVIKGIIKELVLIKDQIKILESNSINEKLNEEIKSLNNIKEENKKLLDEVKKLNEEVKTIKDLNEKNKKTEEELNLLKKEIKEIKDLHKNIPENKILNEEKEESNSNINESKEIKKYEDENKSIQLQLDEIFKILKPIRVITSGIYNKTSLMDINEFHLIKTEIEKKVNKKVKGLEKLYQATIDGGDSSIFHYKCDNIPNTITIICSAMRRRFGGFTTEVWDTSGKYKDDKKSFLFSLDKRKIYSYKCNKKAIYCHKDYGPTFGAGFTIKIGGNAIREKKLYTYEFYPDGCSYNFGGDETALSESGKGGASYIYSIEYEVFKVLFYDLKSDFLIID